MLIFVSLGIRIQLHAWCIIVKKMLLDRFTPQKYMSIIVMTFQVCAVSCDIPIVILMYFQPFRIEVSPCILSNVPVLKNGVHSCLPLCVLHIRYYVSHTQCALGTRPLAMRSINCVCSIMYLLGIVTLV